MQLPLSLPRFRPFERAVRIERTDRQTMRGYPVAVDDDGADQADRERQTAQHLRSLGIWESFLHLGAGPTIRR